MAFKVINNEVITDSSVLQNTTIDESNVLNNVFNVTDGTTSQQINRGDTVTFTAGAGVTITQLNGTVTISSDVEGIEDLVSPLLVHSNHTYIDATYDDINDQVLLAVNITTDGVAEGSTNLYYDDALVDARIALQTGIYLDLSGKDTDDLVEGSTNLYYDDSLARAAISVTGDLSYDNITGVISYSTPTNVSTFTNDAGYLTSYTETDPVFTASPAGGILAGDITNWNTAYGWGDHSSAGYLTSYTETDPVFTASPAGGILAGDITNWNTAYGWGDHSSAGYLTSYTDTNTTYSISSETGTGGANLRLTGSDTSTDNVLIAGGTNVTVTRTDANTITISSTDTNTTYTAGTGVDITSEVISIGQDVATTADVLFNTLETTAGATIGGNLTVNGSITYINSNEVNIGDNIIVLNYDETSGATQNAGIEVERGTDVNVSLLWNETTNRWTFTNDGSNYYNLPEPSEYDVDTNTTYDLTVPAATTAIRLAGSNSTNDDIAITGGANVTVTRTSATELTISSTDTDTTYSNGSGIDLTGTVFSHSDTSSQASLTALVGANVVSDIDLDGFGHVTSLATRTMTLADLGYTGSTTADHYYGWNLHVGGVDRGDVLSSETIDFVAGGGIGLTYSTTNDNTITIAHSDTSAAANLTATSRRYVSGLTFDTYGHVTGYSTGTETVTDTNNYVSSLSFNTGDGVLTANRSGLTALTVDLDGRYLLSSDYVDTYTSGATFNTSDGVITFTRNDATTYTVDIDGRYLQSYTETQTLQDVTDLGATTTNAISITNTTSSTSPTTGALKVSGGVGIAENLYIGGDTNIAGDTLISGNLTVLGTTTTVDVASLSISDNLIYLNNGGTATITNAVGNGSTVTYTADNNFSAGYSVDVTGVNPSAYNVSGATITSANATSFTISSTATGTYVSGGSARAHTNTNVDLGWAGSYNDGSYAHAGIFRDATDGRFKIFDGYTPEPDDSIDIDTTHASFSLADIQAATFIGNLTGNASTATSAGKWTTPRTITLGGDLTGNVNIDGSTNVTLTATIAANSVALGTDTTGNYVGTLAAGTSGVQSGTSGLTISATAGEGTAATIAHADTSTAANLSATSRTYVNSLTFDTYGHVTAYGTATETVTDTDTTYSISSETGTGGANLRLTAGGSGSGTDDVLFAGGTNVTVARTDANTITISSTDTNTTYSAGAGIDLTGTTFSHTDTSTAANLTASGRRYVTGLTFDTYGHVTGYSTGTETVVNTDTNTTYDHLAVTTTGGALLRLHGSDGVNDDVKFASGSNVTVAYTDANTITISSTDTDTNNYVTGLSFATGTGVLTATRLGLSDLTVNLDGRYLTSYTETDTLQTVTGRGNTTNTAVVITNTTASTSTSTGALRVSGGAGIAGNAYIGGNAVITGNLTVNGTTTTVNSTTVTLDDPIMTLGGDTAPTADDNKDRGIEFRWHNGTSAKVGFFGFDDSTGKFTFIPDGTNTSEVFSGTKGEIDAYVNWSNIQGAPAYDNYGSWTLYTDGTNRGGITSGEIVNFVGGTNVTLGYNATNNTITISSTDTDTVYTLPAATSTTLGGIELFSDTVQSVAANAVSATASRTYGVQVNSAGQAVVNVPWVDTNTETESFRTQTVTDTDTGYTWATTGSVVADSPTDTLTWVSGSGIDIDVDAAADAIRISNTYSYTLPEATSTVRGGIELFSDTDQTVAANAVSATAGRTYGIQLNSAGQAVVNVPWVDTNTTYSVATTSANGLMSSTDKTKLDGIEAGATADQTASEILTAIKTVDGDSSGLDADLLDGVQGSSYLRSDVDDTFTGQLTISNTSTGSTPYGLYSSTALDTQLRLHRQGTGGAAIEFGNANGGADVDLGRILVQSNGIFFSGTDLIDHKMWHAGNDGAGTGLDADLLDGQQGSYYQDASNLNAGTVPDARISGSYTGMTNLTGSGTVDFANFLGNAADTAAAPSFSWTGDTNTGMYQPAADQLGFATGGTGRLTLTTAALTSTVNFTAPIFYSSGTTYYARPATGLAAQTTTAGSYFNDLRVGSLWQGVPAAAGPILTYTLTSGGTGYTDGTYTNVVVSGGQGVYATFDFTVVGGIVTVATLTERGSGFQVGNTLAIPVLPVTTGTGSGGVITVNTVRSVDLSLYNAAAKIRLASNDTTLTANQEMGGIYFNARDASAGGAGDKAYILGVAEGTSGGGKIQFWTSANGGSPTLCAEVGGSNDFRLYNTAGTFYHSFSNAPTANRVLTLPDAAGTVLVAQAASTAGYFDTSTTAPAGTTRINYNGAMYVNSLTATADVTAYSDERLKENIEAITDAVNKVEQLRGVTYTRKSDGTASTGVIAQDVQAVLPEAVNADSDGMLSVKYGNMVGLLIEAIKEQNETIKGMQAEIAELKARLNN